MGKEPIGYKNKQGHGHEDPGKDKHLQQGCHRAGRDKLRQEG